MMRFLSSAGAVRLATTAVRRNTIKAAGCGRGRGKIPGRAFFSPWGRYQTEGMASSLPIGDFSRATHMSIKTLRHYHRVGQLEPADVDQFTGHRRYTTAAERKRRGAPRAPLPSAPRPHPRNHDDVTSSLPCPRRCHIVVAAPGARNGGERDLRAARCARCSRRRRHLHRGLRVAVPLDLLAKILARTAEAAAEPPEPLRGQRIRPDRLTLRQDTGPGAARPHRR
jgi:MerR family regulatory protein